MKRSKPMGKAIRVLKVGFASLAVVAVVSTGWTTTSGTLGAGTAAAATSTGGWGPARALPSTNGVASVACPSAGNCVAGGASSDNQGKQAFVISEVNGTWQQPLVLPGTEALNRSGDAETKSVSCVSAGNCTAGGYYDDRRRNLQGFVANEVNGTWQQAEEVPGTATLRRGANSLLEIDFVSCASAGNCSVGGHYYDRKGNTQLFVVDEVNGTWQPAEELPGLATLNQNPPQGPGAVADLNSLSCASAGNCSAGGDYTDRRENSQAFVANEVDGTWQRAEEVPGTARLNRKGSSWIGSLSCVSAGNCSAGGAYNLDTPRAGVFVVDEVNGTWQQAEEVPGFATLQQKGDAAILSVSCTSMGNCSADGYYSGRHGQQALVVDEVNGTWQRAQEAPGISTLNRGGYAEFDTVSCASAGNCSAGGYYSNGADIVFPLIATEVNGTWQRAEGLPGVGALHGGDDQAVEVESVSCPSVTDCSAGGTYAGRGNDQEGFVASGSI